MTLSELYAKRATAWEAAKKFLDTHRMESGMLSGEDAQIRWEISGDKIPTEKREILGMAQHILNGLFPDVIDVDAVVLPYNLGHMSVEAEDNKITVTFK